MLDFFTLFCLPLLVVTQLLLIKEVAFLIVAVKVSDDEDDDDKLGDADGDADSEKLSQSLDNASDKPDAPMCPLRSGMADQSLSNCFAVPSDHHVMY